MKEIFHADNYNINELIEQYQEYGYVVLDGFYTESQLNSINADVDSLFVKDWGIDNLKFLSVVDENGDLIDIRQTDYISLPKDKQDFYKNSGNWRIHSFHEHSASVKSAAYNQNVLRIVDALIGEISKPGYSINFYKGSNQGLHQDDAVFHISPPGNLIGAWIALENIDQKSGPLVFYPKSHKEPLFAGFSNYPYTNLRTADDKTFSEYIKYMDDLVQKYERKVFLPKKGQFLLWHGGLIHGGSDIIDSSLTRKSLVFHYRPDKYEKFDEIQGPVRWEK